MGDNTLERIRTSSLTLIPATAVALSLTLTPSSSPSPSPIPIPNPNPNQVTTQLERHQGGAIEAHCLTVARATSANAAATPDDSCVDEFLQV